MNEKLLFLVRPAFPPKEDPIPSSQAKIPLDRAICRDGLKVLFFPQDREIRGELYSGINVLSPSFIQGVRAGIEIINKKILFDVKSSSLSEVINRLSICYSNLKDEPCARINLENEEILNKFLLQKPGARIMLRPSTTYNHLSAPHKLNEVWVGSDMESYHYSSAGNISPNIEDALNTESRGHGFAYITNKK